MDKEIVEYEPNEWNYTCPYCENISGWTNYPNEEDTEHNCDNCKRNFIVKGIK